MSGKQQHYVPQFLQDGFASHSTDKAAFTWVYRKNTPPFNTNIKNVGAEGYFYTSDGDTEADDSITKAERSYSKLIADLRTQTPGISLDPKIPELIAHLEVRTRHLRENFLRSGSYIVSRFLDFMGDGERFARLMFRRITNDPTILRDSVLEEITKRNLSRKLLKPIMRKAMHHMPTFMAMLAPRLPQLAAEIRSVVPAKLVNGAKDGHVRGLKKSVAPTARLEQYTNVEYSVRLIPSKNLILGDSPVLFHVSGEREYKTFFEKRDVLKAVILPLSSDRCLVGAAAQEYEVPGGISRAVASSSLEHFVAADNSDFNRTIALVIGENAALISHAEMERIIAEVFDE